MTRSFLYCWIVTALCMVLSASASYAQSSYPSSEKEKKPICGLVTMGFIGKVMHGKIVNNLAEITVHPGIYSAVVLNFSWSQLEPEQGQFDFSAIDSDLSGLQAYNRAHPEKPVTAKLRISGGMVAPAWVKQLAGTVSLNQKNSRVEIGRFWTPVYRQAWRDLQVALAAHYDPNPLVQEVAISSCSTVTDEPFNLPVGPKNTAQLHAAGFSDAQYKTCLAGALDDYAVWHKVALDYTFNPMKILDSGNAHLDSTFTTDLMSAFRRTFGSRAVLANHGLQPSVTARQSDIYTEIAKLGPPVAFQTESPTDNFDETWQNGLAYHPTEYEMWVTKDAGGVAFASVDMLQHWASELSCSP